MQGAILSWTVVGRPVSIYSCRLRWKRCIMAEERLIHEVEGELSRLQVCDTSSFNCKNPNKEAAGWREIARELQVSGYITCHFQ